MAVVNIDEARNGTGTKENTDRLVTRLRSPYRDDSESSVGAAEPYKRSVSEIVQIYRELKTFYLPWHEQQLFDDRFYNLIYDVAMSENPHNFEAVRPPTATTIVDMAADHAAGNYPRLHIPKRKETTKAEDRATLMMKAGQGFWYSTIASYPVNILRDWAQSAALRGAICGSLLYNPDKWPLLPQPSKLGGIHSQEYKDACDDVYAERRSLWPFELQYIDPLDVFPDPATEGKDFIIHAFERRAYEIKRAWPNWDWTVPGSSRQAKSTDWVTFIAYWDAHYKRYIIAGKGTGSVGGEPLIPLQDGVVEHGYGFMPYIFIPGGFGSPFGLPQYRYRGILTNIRDLLKLEARRMTHMDAIIAQQAFPWLIKKRSVIPDMQLGGVTTVPDEMSVRDAVMELRPQIPIAELVTELHENRQAIQRSSIPDALGGLEGKSGESGYLRSINVGTGRSKLRSLSDSLERACECATSGFFRLVENKAKGPVSIWGKGMDEEQEFVTIKPEDIDGHYEVYVSIVPSLPQDEAMNITNGLKLHERGLIPDRDMLQTYAARENAEDLLMERRAEDILKSPQATEQMVNDALAITRVAGGPIVQPGVRTAGVPSIGGFGEHGQSETTPPGPTGMPGPYPAAGPAGIPTPPAQPGSPQEAALAAEQAARGGMKPAQARGTQPR